MEHRKKRELVRKYQWRPVSSYGRPVCLEAEFVPDSSAISGIQAEGMAFTSGVRLGVAVAVDQVRGNSIVSKQYLGSGDVSRKDDRVSLFLWGRDEKRTPSDCDIRASQEKASRKSKEEFRIERADENTGDLRFDFIAREKEFIAEENLCVARTEVEASKNGGTITSINWLKVFVAVMMTLAIALIISLCCLAIIFEVFELFFLVCFIVLACILPQHFKNAFYSD